VSPEPSPKGANGRRPRRPPRIASTPTGTATTAPDDYATWLDTDVPLKDAHALLKPFPAELMAAGEANPLVNSPKNEGAQLLDPAA
jgi:hypothetical protein